MIRGFIILLAGLILFPDKAFSQWEEATLTTGFSLPPVALVDIEPGTDNSLSFTAIPASESGVAPEFQQSSSQALWLNYSSALPEFVNTRSIVAQISGGTLPEGVSLKMEALPFEGSGAGQVGQPLGEILLTNQPQSIISNVGNCFTGDGENNGHQLVFSIEVTDYSQFAATQEASFTILYTISDN